MGCVHSHEPQRHGAGLPDLLPGSGRFGRLFERSPVPDHHPDHLRVLARTMITRPEPDKDLGEADDDENASIPAGYTYLGQFIDHDITFDPISSLLHHNDPRELLDYRTPRFDLDSVYGRGPAQDPYLYSPQHMLDLDHGRLRTGGGLTFLLGPQADTAGSPDLPRNTVHDPDTGVWGPGRALVGDPRNDENLIISQLHRTFLQFHNAVVDHLLRKEVHHSSVTAVQTALDAGQLAGKLFDDARRLVCWHYQWVIVHDFLPRICGTIVNDLLRGGRPRLEFFLPAEGSPTIPVEFSAAAYRFGHSMVRPSYFTSDAVRAQRTEQQNQPLRLPIVGPGGAMALANLDGFRPLPEAGGIEWKYFFPELGDASPDGKPLPQASYKIDTHLAYPLGDLPMPIVSGGSRSLAERNLLRGRSLGLPSGQWVAEQMRVRPLSDEQLELTIDKLHARLDQVDAVETDRLIRAAARDFAGSAPLWYYILKEAELAGGGKLGEVGGRIVAEVLLGLLDADPQSYLRAAPDWQPMFTNASGAFDMTALIRSATPQMHATVQQREIMTTTTTGTSTSPNGNSTTPQPAAPAPDPAAAPAVPNPTPDLNSFILGGVPYRYDDEHEPTLVAAPPAAHTIEPGPAVPQAVKDGPAKDFGENQRLAQTSNDGVAAVYNGQATSPLSEEWIRAYPWESLWWTFEGKSHRVVKAVRIAYTVEQEGNPVTKHILIGYEGVDPMG